MLPSLRDVDLSFESPENLTMRGPHEGFAFPIVEDEEERGVTPCRASERSDKALEEVKKAPAEAKRSRKSTF